MVLQLPPTLTAQQPTTIGGPATFLRLFRVRMHPFSHSHYLKVLPRTSSAGKKEPRPRLCRSWLGQPARSCLPAWTRHLMSRNAGADGDLAGSEPLRNSITHNLL